MSHCNIEFEREYSINFKFIYYEEGIQKIY
jgi:hypothetical protein